MTHISLCPGPDQWSARSLVTSSPNAVRSIGLVTKLSTLSRSIWSCSFELTSAVTAMTLIGRRRKRFLVRANRGVDVQGLVTTWLSRVKVPGAVRVVVDVDPYSFL